MPSVPCYRRGEGDADLVRGTNVGALRPCVSSSWSWGFRRERTVLAQTPPNDRDLRIYAGLHAAAAAGDVAEIERLIAAGERPNIQDSSSRTPLHVAVFRKHHDAVRALIRLGANPNALEAQRFDVVTIAVVQNDLDMLKLLLEAGASPRTVFVAVFERVGQPVEPDRGHGSAELAVAAGKVACRRVVRDPGPACDLSQSEPGDAVGLEDLDRALQQALTGGEHLRRGDDVDSVHIGLAGVNPGLGSSGRAWTLHDGDRFRIRSRVSGFSVGGRRRLSGRVVPARVTARVVPRWRGTSTTETIVPACASYSTTFSTAA